MLNKAFFLSLILITWQVGFAQIDSVGSGRCLNFDGLDDYIELGNIYDDLDLPVSIEAWIYFDTETTTPIPIFTSQDNLPLYNGITLIASSTHMSIQYGDGMGENYPQYRRGKGVNFPSITGRWTHIGAVMRGKLDMDLYINGINVGGFYVGESDYPISSNWPADVAKIGYWHSNGQTLHFRGKMDELRLWDYSRSQSQIREYMCKKLKGNEAGLIGYWNFNETSGSVLFDKSSGAFNGQLKGNPTRLFSGAPIGDESIYQYSGSWSNFSLAMITGSDQLTVHTIQGNPEGIHLYKVNSLPSQTGGLDLSVIEKPYFGAFVAATHGDNSFNLTYLVNGQPTCKSFVRNNNSKTSWNELISAIGIQDRIEVVKILGERFEFDLGPPLHLCDETHQVLSTGIMDQSLSVLWNTGETTSEIDVTQSGMYWVKISGECNVGIDTVSVQFDTHPVVFLGIDEQLCEFEPQVIKPMDNPERFELIWNDGSNGPSKEVNEFGVYWVTAKNFCGIASDTISITRKILELDNIPNVITPNGDQLNDVFIVTKDNELTGENISIKICNRWGQEVFTSSDYKNDWNGLSLSSGVYFYQVYGECASEKKGTITILR